MKRIYIYVLLVSLFMGLAVNVCFATEKVSQNSWTVIAGGSYQKFNRANGWGYGPSFGLQYAFSPRLGVRVHSTLILHTDGFYDGFFLAMDGGIIFRFSSLPSWLTFNVGGSFYSGSDNDGSLWSTLGFHAGITATWWFSRHIGIPFNGTLRYWIKDDPSYTGEDAFSPSISTGIAFRF